MVWGKILGPGKIQSHQPPKLSIYFYINYSTITFTFDGHYLTRNGENNILNFNLITQKKTHKSIVGTQKFNINNY